MPMNQEVSDYIKNAPQEQSRIMETLRGLIHTAVPSVEEHIKWGRPVFSSGNDIAYFKTAKAYLTFGIFKFNKIKSHADLLEGTGKDMRHIKLKKEEDINREVIQAWLDELTH